MNGAADLYIRQQNAANSFVASVVEQFGFTEAQAEHILTVYRAAKAVKLDPVDGQFHLTHGAFWERQPMVNALAVALNTLPKPRRRRKA